MVLILVMSWILSLTSQSNICSASNCSGDDHDYVKSLVTRKITRDFCIVKVAPLGSLHDAASAISKKVSYHKGIGIRNFGESHLRYQKNGAIRVVG